MYSSVPKYLGRYLICTILFSFYIYRKTYCCYVTPDEKTPIEDNTYDVMLCSAGMFPGSIVPQAFKELIRIVKPGGILAWNIGKKTTHFSTFISDTDMSLNIK